MKTKDLRIGNIFKEKYTGDILIVSELTKNRITFDYQTNEKWQAEPIPITEEILLKCGFRENEFGLHNGILSFLFRANKKFIPNIFDVCLKEIYYLHQLQNLYYALTGEELEIKF